MLFRMKPSFPIRPNSVPLLFWRLFQVLSVHVTLCLVGYQAAFDASMNTWHYLFIYLGDFTYLVNTVLYFLTAIKNKGKVTMIQDKDVIIKQNLNAYFVTDVLSLLPLEIFGFASSSVLFTTALLRLNRALRIIRITDFLCKMQEDIRMNLMASNIVTILSVTLFVLNMCACMWYALACDNIVKGGACLNGTWATMHEPHEGEHEIEIAESSSSTRYMLSFYFVLQTIFTIGYGDFHPVNNKERIFAIAIMLSTYIAYGLILGRSAAILAGFNFRRQTFKHRFAIIRKYLKRACIHENLQEKVIKYYEYTWEHSFGNTVDNMIDGLPIITRHCIVKNLYSHMFNEVSFLKNAPESFLKEITLITQKVILVPDQIILHKGQVQNSMCFISHGELEVQQGSSTRKLGDCQYFGEISLIYPVYSNATIKSLTDCELFVINRDALREVLYFHPEIADSLRNSIQMSVRRLFDHDIFAESEEIRQSSNMCTLGSTIKSHGVRNSHDSSSTQNHMVEKLRKWIQLLADWIIYPNSMFWMVWEKIMLLTVLVVVNWYMIEATYSSYYRENAYGYNSTGNWKFVLTYCVEVLFVFDIFVSMKKATFVHIHHGTSVTQKDIRGKYIRSVTFYLDIMAVLPLEIFAPAFSNPWESVPGLKLNRLLKLWKFCVIMTNMSKYLYNSEGKILAIKLVSLIIITINFFGCMLFSVVCSYRGGKCVKGSWPHFYHGILDSDDSLTGYTTAFYWVATTMSQTGYGDIHAHLTFEYILSISVMTIGFLVFNISLISITAILLNSSYSKKLFREVLSALHKYIRFHIEEKEVIRDVNHHLDLLWSEYRGEGYSTAELLHELPENLKDEVILNELGGILQNVPFFEGTETGFLKKLAKIVSSNLHCPGDFVYHAGDLGEEMYFVRKGFVEILSEDLSHVVNKLGSGGYFGEFGMLNRVPYNATVRCATYCEILSMSRNDLDQLLKSYPSLQKELKQWEAANERMKDIQANVGKAVPIAFSTYGAHSALAAAMIVPVSIAIQKPLICNVAGWWSNNLRKKIACPISCGIAPANTYVHYNKTCDDPSLTAEVHQQRVASSEQNDEKTEVPFKVNPSGLIISQASGLFEKRKMYTNNVDQIRSDITLPKTDTLGHRIEAKLDRFFSFFLMPYVIMPKSTFNVYWAIMVTVLCYVSTYTLTLQAAFFEYVVTLWIINYFIDAVMLANVFLGLHTAYYNEEGVLITNPLMCAKHYLKTNFFYEFFANIMPTDIFAFLSKDHKLSLLALLRLNRIIRIRRVIAVFQYLETWIVIPVVLARAIGFFVSLLLITHWVACLWDIIACPHIRDSCVPDGWGVFTGDDHGMSVFIPIGNKSDFEKYAIGYYWAVVTTTQVGYGDIIAYTNIERWFTSIVMILGAIGYGYSISTVASCFGHTAYGRLAFQDRLHNMEFYLNEKKAGRGAVDRVMNYYNFLWKRTSGLNLIQLMKGLPLSLQTELSFHVYKKIIRKMTLFKDVELSFIKLVSRYCKPVFIPKDEFIIKTGDICPLMHFITKGTVDVVSEDGEIVYETLKEGDYFGEMCCLCGTPSLASFKASRNCDLFTLDKSDLDTCLHFHKDLSSKIFRVANIRYQTLKNNVKASTISINNKRRMSNVIRSSGIDVEDIELGILGNDNVTPLDVETDNAQIPWFKYPLHFTISYQNNFIKFLSVVSILFNIVLSIIIPYETFYNERHISFRVIIILSEVFYLIEMYFKFHTTFEDEHGIEVKDLSSIVRHYLKSKSGFAVDLIAVIPFEVLGLTIPDEFYQERVYLILQLIHLVRMFRIVLILNPEYWKIPRWFYFVGIYVLCFLLLIFIVHWITSIAFFFNYGAYDSWEQAVENLTSVPHELYLRNIYLIVATMTTTGYGDIPINYISDALFVSVITIIAKLLYSFIVGYYSSISSTAVVRQVDAKQDFDGLQLYMDENELHGAKKVKVLHYVEYIWERNHGYHLVTLFADLPFALKREIRLISTISAIGKVHFLSNVDKNFLGHLSLLLKSMYFIPGQFIVHKYDLRQCMYFISNGTVELYENDDDSEAKKILRPRDNFCEETLFNSQPVQYSAKCVDYVDMFVLEKTDFEDMLTIYPESIQAISSIVGRGWGVNYLHRSKARRMSIPQNNTSYDGIL